MPGMPLRRPSLRFSFGISAIGALLVPLLVGGCGPSGGSTGTAGTTGSGGAAGTTGAGGSAGTTGVGGNAAGTGGSVSTAGTGGNGGSTGATGGSGAGGTGGTTGSGGSAGATGTGGSAGTGGAVGSGGASAGRGGGGGRGGSGGTGGSAGSGGSTGTGGSGGAGTCPVISDFATWPSGKGPSNIGPLAVTNFKPHTGDAYSGAGYAWTFAYVASLQYTQLTGDTTNNDYLVSHFDCTQAGPGNSTTSGSRATVDDRAFGDLPLEIFIEKGTAACQTLGMARADAQWTPAADTAITPDARYWSDDMFMITGLQDFGYRATKTEKYLDRAALTMVSYLSMLQQSDGLMWHTKMTMAKWGRANGWFAAGMALLLQDLPTSNTNRATIMTGYKNMMAGLLPVQIASGTDAGAWRQVLDRTDAGAEMSCTAMFTYALVTGLKNGWISGTQYSTAARNGWIALGNKTNSSGQLSQVCPGTGQAAGSAGVGTDLTSQQNFYINLQSMFSAGDQHGQAPLLWSAIALLRTDCPGMR